MATPSRQQPTLYVIDDEFVPPDRGDEQDGPRGAAPAGDPDEAVRLLHRYRRLMADILGYEEPLQPPASEADIAAAEDDLGLALPPDLRALYGVADGDGDLVNPLFDRNEWFSLAEIADHDDEWLDIAQEWQYEPWRRTVFDSRPPGAVRRSPLRPGWIRFATDTGGNWLAVDMDPGPRGRPGQVIAVGVDYGEGPTYVADSVTAFLRRLVEALERGAYVRHDTSLWIESDLPDLPVEPAEYSGGPPSPEDARQAGPRVQKVRVTGAADCAFLAETPDVLSLALASDGAPDLSALGGLPVEYLELDVAAADLAAPARNPELRALSVASARPVELAPLRSAPRLWALDIAAAPVADLAAVAGLAGLRYLEVTAEQWRGLSALGGPPHLAVVGVHPRRPRREWPLGADWTTEYGTPPATTG
ncbi:cell wall assembly regulator SMI1 [Streptomonospora nanhaiensis]|uniref:Cell wall assembly regulator SMI1 n=1 Tax=Streptomonospora nanhaiensis TaxID=1323731 RepID=A0A853BRG2_9ACTN|nr:SMI1/KNR4 family protein [Streptomonospora nanhaiensis]NYI97286.1 cell wall assembly regulator SMI1 [Streptomonospora nanhaiensis]